MASIKYKFNDGSNEEITVTPSTGGKGTTPLSIVSPNYTGRASRTATIKSQFLDIPEVNASAVGTQPGKAEFITITTATSEVGYKGGTVTIQGTSNSSKLTFTSVASEVEGIYKVALTIPSTYTVNASSSITVNTNTAITGDPGAKRQYNFSITITAPANSSPEHSNFGELVVTTNNNQTATFRVNIAPAPALLNFLVDGSEATTFTIPTAGGTSTNVSVQSSYPFELIP